MESRRCCWRADGHEPLSTRWVGGACRPKWFTPSEVACCSHREIRSPLWWTARMSTLFSHVPHPHISARHQKGPVRVADAAQPPIGAPWYQRVNATLAVKITNGVGTMWCAYVFSIIALIGLPQAISDSTSNGFEPLPLVQWLAQTFLQLVLLSIILVGQNVLAAASDQR